MTHVPIHTPSTSHSTSHSTSSRTRRRRRAAWPWLALTLLAIGVFAGWPGIDLAVSQAARQAGGEGAPAYAWGLHPLVQAVYWTVPWIGRLALLAGLVLMAWRRPVSPGLQRWRARAPWIVAMLVLGVWLVVNAGFKEHWGRPRPAAVETLGGSQPFRSIAQPSALCDSNCSFPSGHAAQGYAVMVIGLLAAPGRRRRWARIGLLAGLLVGAGRVLQGGHFLSDILFAGLMVWGVALLLRAVAVRGRARRMQRGLQRGMPHPGAGADPAAVISRSRPLSNIR
ncbi:phosphatase PAP2 family protein [Leptothrix discophora]|uniref:Phosphatase PAP2 family protein n=1 Tax=Leptothrix discophora TaxID=89 RepID=A0ABT9G6H8_LEPDI|nr:phosphatase PAP2 family protein [Leptothrix discophora]MDP4302098.1 phosphatase PAP2 family protein [Leptothrix discophora]